MGAQLPGPLAGWLGAPDFDAKEYHGSIERCCGTVSCSAGLGACPALPLRGISTCMKDAKNHGAADSDDVENRVRKATHERTTNMMANFGKRFWMSVECFEHRFKRSQEILRERSTAIPIPGEGLRQISLSLRRESNRHSDSVSRDRIVDQD